MGQFWYILTDLEYQGEIITLFDTIQIITLTFRQQSSQILTHLSFFSLCLSGIPRKQIGPDISIKIEQFPVIVIVLIPG